MAEALSPRRLAVITIGCMLGMFMASMEVTVVATAMPTIVGKLGGLETYSWVFSGYLLTSTTTVPLYGKFSDLYGRRRVFAVAMALFLVGSLLCGLARSMEQLVAFRLVQGLGAGGLLPLAFIIIGDIFSYQQRARVQGLFAGVWGVSSVIGPLLGGFLVEQISWPWVFYFNIAPGILAGLVVWLGLKEAPQVRLPGVPVDYAGTVLLTGSAAALLLGVQEPGTAASWGLLALAAVLLLALVRAERRAPDPILPIALFRDRLFVAACLHGVLAGWAVFGSMAFVPLFAQAVRGTSPTAAGATLMPLMLAWVTSSVVSTRLLLRVRYRTLVLSGTALFNVGALLLARVSENTSSLELGLALTLMGIGMGAAVPVFLIVVQSTVERRYLGIATSTLQFSRSIGGTVGISVMGAALSLWLVGNLRAAGLDPNTVSVNALLDPIAAETAGLSLSGPIRDALGSAIQGVFVIALVGAVLALMATALAPNARLEQSARREAGPSPEREVEQTAMMG